MPSEFEKRLASWVGRRRAAKPGITEADRSHEGRGRVALVTGASSGIGASFAELYAAKGFTVVALARRTDRLEALRVRLDDKWGATVHPLGIDLGAADAVGRVDSALRALGLPVDVLVNNAGYGVMGRYLDRTWDDHEQFVRAVGIVPAHLCHRLVPHMVEQGWGRVINVSSVAALFAGSPEMVLYSGVKSLVLKMTEGLAEEYESAGVHFTASIPGVTDTEFFAQNDMAEFARTSLKAQLPMMRPETVARQAYKACEQARRVVIHGAQHKGAMFVAVHAPPAIRYWFVRHTTNLEFDDRSGAPVMSRAGTCGDQA